MPYKKIRKPNHIKKQNEPKIINKTNLLEKQKEKIKDLRCDFSRLIADSNFFEYKAGIKEEYESLIHKNDQKINRKTIKRLEFFLDLLNDYLTDSSSNDDEELE